MDLKTVQTLLAEHSITKIKVGGFDIDGVLRGKYISRDKFDSAAETGLGFCDVIFGWDSSDALYDNVKVTGWHTGYPDALARIDLSTFRVIPWEPDGFLHPRLLRRRREPSPRVSPPGARAGDRASAIYGLRRADVG